MDSCRVYPPCEFLLGGVHSIMWAKEPALEALKAVTFRYKKRQRFLGIDGE